MSKNKITIYEARDRQGTKHFSEKPVFESGFDIFSGKKINLPKDRKCYRLIKRYKTKVVGHMAKTSGLYPQEILVKPANGRG